MKKILIVGCLILCGCASTSDIIILDNRVKALKEEVAKSKELLLELEKDIRGVSERTTNVVKGDTFNSVKENQGELHSRLLNVSKELQLLTGRFDEHKYSVEKNMKDSASEREVVKLQITNIENSIKDVKNKISALENQIVQQKEIISKLQKEQDNKNVEIQVEKPKEDVVNVEDKTKMYEQANTLFKEKKYKDAREKFVKFMEKFSSDEFADEAQMLIAESFYEENDFENAILSCETLIKKYPKSDKIPVAFLKQGLSFMELGDKKTGKVILQKLIENYPKSKEAKISSEKIKEPVKEAVRVEKKNTKNNKKKK